MQFCDGFHQFLFVFIALNFSEKKKKTIYLYFFFFTLRYEAWSPGALRPSNGNSFAAKKSVAKKALSEKKGFDSADYQMQLQLMKKKTGVK